MMMTGRSLMRKYPPVKSIEKYALVDDAWLANWRMLDWQLKRTIPIGRELVDRLAAHLAEFPAAPVEVLDETSTRPVTRMVRLVCTTATSQPWPRPRYSERVWRPSLIAVGLADTGRTGAAGRAHLP